MVCCARVAMAVRHANGTLVATLTSIGQHNLAAAWEIKLNCEAAVAYARRVASVIAEARSQALFDHLAARRNEAFDLDKLKTLLRASLFMACSVDALRGEEVMTVQQAVVTGGLAMRYFEKFPRRGKLLLKAVGSVGCIAIGAVAVVGVIALANPVGITIAATAAIVVATGYVFFRWHTAPHLQHHCKMPARRVFAELPCTFSAST
jgi:hypothetical protein